MFCWEHFSSKVRPVVVERPTDLNIFKRKKIVEKRRGIIFLKFIKGTEGFFNTNHPISVAKFYKILKKIIGCLKLQQR
jgi:hypothetical protein